MPASSSEAEPLPSTSAERPLVLLGGGEHACVVADAAVAAGRRLLGYLDVLDKPELERRFGIPRLSTVDEGHALVPAVGSAAVRETFAGAHAADRFSTVVHPRATIGASVHLAEGVVVLAGAVVNVGAVVEAHAIVNSGAIVEHDVVVGRYTHVAPGAVVGGGARIGARVHVGLGARIRDHVRIGDGATIAMGAVVVDDVAPGALVAGIPARPMSRE